MLLWFIGYFVNGLLTMMVYQNILSLFLLLEPPNAFAFNLVVRTINSFAAPPPHIVKKDDSFSAPPLHIDSVHGMVE